MVRTIDLCGADDSTDLGFQTASIATQPAPAVQRIQSVLLYLSIFFDPASILVAHRPRHSLIRVYRFRAASSLSILDFVYLSILGFVYLSVFLSILLAFFRIDPEAGTGKSPLSLDYGRR